DHPPADELLVFDQGQVRLDPRRITVHKKPNRSCWGENGDLGVAIAEFFAVGESFVPAGFGAFEESGGDGGLVDVIDGGAVHADDVEERLAIDVEAGAGPAGHGV